MKNFTKDLLKLLLIGLLFISVNLIGQINISPGPIITPVDMVENIVGEGVQYSNVTYTGANAARGIFSNGGSTNLGINSGIFLTSGAGYVIPGTQYRMWFRSE